MLRGHQQRDGGHSVVARGGGLRPRSGGWHSVRDCGCRYVNPRAVRVSLLASSEALYSAEHRTAELVSLFGENEPDGVLGSEPIVERGLEIEQAV